MPLTIPWLDFEVLEGGGTTDREVTASAASQAPFAPGPGTGILDVTGSSGVVSFNFSSYTEDVPAIGFATIDILDPDALLIGADIPPQLSTIQLVLPYSSAGPNRNLDASPLVVYNGGPSNLPSAPHYAFLTRKESENPIFTALKNVGEFEFAARIFPRHDSAQALFSRPSIAPTANPGYPMTWDEVNGHLLVDVGGNDVAVSALDDSALAVGDFLPTDQLQVAVPTESIILSWRLLQDMGFDVGDDSTIPFTMESQISIGKVRIYPTAAPTNFKDFPAVQLTGINANKVSVNFAAFYPEMIGTFATKMPTSEVAADPEIFADLEFTAINSRFAGAPALFSDDIDPTIFSQLEDIVFGSVAVDIIWPLDYNLSSQVQIKRTDGFGPTIIATLSNPLPGGPSVDLMVGATLLSLAAPNVVFDPYNSETIQPQAAQFTNPTTSTSPPPDPQPVPVGVAVQPIDLCLFRGGVVFNNLFGAQPPLVNQRPANPNAQPGQNQQVVINNIVIGPQWGLLQVMVGGRGFGPFPFHAVPFYQPGHDRKDLAVADGTPERWRNFGTPSVAGVGLLMPDLNARKFVSRTVKRPKNILGTQVDVYNPWLSAAFLFREAPGDPEITSRSRSVGGARRWNTPELIDLVETQEVTLASRPGDFTLQELLDYKAEWMLSELGAYSEVMGEEFVDPASLDFTVGLYDHRSIGIFGPKHVQLLPYGGTPGDIISRFETVGYPLVDRPDNIFIMMFATGPLQVQISLDDGASWFDYNPGTWDTTVAYPALMPGDPAVLRIKVLNLNDRHIFVDSMYVFWDNAAQSSEDYLTPDLIGIPAGEPDPHPIAAD